MVVLLVYVPMVHSINPPWKLQLYFYVCAKDIATTLGQVNDQGQKFVTHNWIMVARSEVTNWEMLLNSRLWTASLCGRGLYMIAVIAGGWGWWNHRFGAVCICVCTCVCACVHVCVRAWSTWQNDNIQCGWMNTNCTKGNLVTITQPWSFVITISRLLCAQKLFVHDKSLDNTTPCEHRVSPPGMRTSQYITLNLKHTTAHTTLVQV